MASHEPTPASGRIPAINPATGHAREIETQIVAQALRDAAFREHLLAEPRAVFAEMGLTIPPQVQIQTVQETAERYYLVLPAAQQAAPHVGASLSDAELENIAGGTYTDDTSWTGCGTGQSGCILTNAVDCNQDSATSC